MLIRARSVSESNATAVHLTLEGIIFEPSDDVLLQVLRVVFSIPLEHRLQQDPFRAIRDRLFCIHYPDAVLFEFRLVCSRIVPVTGETVHFISDHDLELALCTVPDHTLEVWPLVCFTSESLVTILADNEHIVPFCEVVALAQLHVD